MRSTGTLVREAVRSASGIEDLASRGPHKVRPLEAGIVTTESVEDLYVRQRLTVEEVAGRLGVCSKTVSRALRRAGIPPRPPAPRVPPVSRVELETLYVGERLSMAEVGIRVGLSPRSVGQLLRGYGIEIGTRGVRRQSRPPGEWDHLLTRDVLMDLYADQGLSALAVAKRLGIPNGGPVLRALRRHGLPTASRGTKRVPGRPLVTKGVLEDLYLDQGLSMEAVAERLGYRDHDTVRRALRRHGISIRPRSDGDRPPLDAALLEELYVRQRQSLNSIGRALGYAPRTLARALRDAGIPVKQSGSWRSNFGPRLEFPRELLVRLYEKEELTIEALGELFEVTPAIVRQRLHEQGIGVRRAGPPPAAGQKAPAEVLLRSLYADRRVRTVLQEHGLGLRRLPLPLPERSQSVAPPHLDPALLRALYVDLELSAFKIELLTGCDKFSVYKQLRRAGIAVRTPAQLRRRTLPRPDVEELYVRRRLSLCQAARELGCSPGLVRESLHRYGIPLRPSGGASMARPLERSLLEDLHVRQGLSVTEIARRSGSSARHVRKYLQLHGLRPTALQQAM